MRLSGSHSRPNYLSENLVVLGIEPGPHDPEALKQNIRESIYSIQQCELQQVSRNLFKRIQACLTA
jgi:hypothetical protein